MTTPKHDKPDAPMLTAGVAVERWKLPIFRKRLKAAGYEFDEPPGDLMPGIAVLRVKTRDQFKLKAVLEECQAEARKSRMN